MCCLNLYIWLFMKKWKKNCRKHLQKNKTNWITTIVNKDIVKICSILQGSQLWLYNNCRIHHNGLPLITCPVPILNSNGFPLSLDESNFLPLVSVPVIFMFKFYICIFFSTENKLYPLPGPEHFGITQYQFWFSLNILVEIVSSQ